MAHSYEPKRAVVIFTGHILIVPSLAPPMLLPPLHHILTPSPFPFIYFERVAGHYLLLLQVTITVPNLHSMRLKKRKKREEEEGGGGGGIGGEGGKWSGCSGRRTKWKKE